MATKENKGGILTNEQVEQDLKAKNKQVDAPYTGGQDNGDKTIRTLGSDVQKADGAPTDEENDEQ